MSRRRDRPVKEQLAEEYKYYPRYPFQTMNPVQDELEKRIWEYEFTVFDIFGCFPKPNWMN